jgi:PAS domain S-box-containing protein
VENVPEVPGDEVLLKAGALQDAIFNSANFSSIATDERGVIQIFNVGAERMLGYSAAEVLNKITPAQISDPRELIARAEALSQELETTIAPGFEALVFKASRGIEDVYELTYIRKDGSRFPAVVSVTALRDDQGGIIGYLLIGTDNTARKQAEDALVKAGALQDAIFNSANFSSIATDAKGVIQIFNVGAERMLGYTAAEVVNKITPADISDPREVIGRAKALSAELNTPITPGFEALIFKASRGIEDIYELTYIRKDGSRLPAVVSVTALRDVQRSIIGYLLIGTDNTARQHAEEERQRLDQRVRDQQFYTRSLIESNIDALMTTDPLGIITDVNKQMEALTGCTRDELIGAPFKTYFTEPERADAGIKLVLGERKVTNYELTALARDGKRTVVSYNATTFYDRDRRLQGVFAAARDITEQKRAEQALQASLADRELLLREIHHRVKNNMQLVCSLLQLQARQLQIPEMSALLQESQSRVRSMALIHEKLYGGDSLARIDLADYLRSLGAMIQRSHSTSTAVRLRFELVPLTAGMDTAVPLGLAVNELLTNALKHAFPEGARSRKDAPEVVVALQLQEDRRLRLEVRDNGVGLPTDFAPERTGSLGMRLVQIFAKQLRCELGWSSGSGGSVFQMSFLELKPKRPQPLSLETADVI